MIVSLSNRTGTPVKWRKNSETQGTEKNAKSAMTDAGGSREV